MEGDNSASDRQRGERGSTKMAELTKVRAKGRRLRLELDAKGNFVGDDEEIAKFPSYLGTCVRSHIPFNIEKWADVDNTYKVNLWDDLTSIFDFDQTILTQKKVFSKAARMWTNYKSRLYCQYVHGNKKGEDPCKKNEWLRREVWEDLVRQRSTKEAEDKRKQAQKAVNSDLIPHTASRGGIDKLKRKMKRDKLEEMKMQMESQGQDSSSLSIVQVPDPMRDQVWKCSKFSKKKGKFVNETCKSMAEKIDKLNELKSQGLFQEKEGTDLLSEVYETPEHSGRVRAAGFGVGIKEFFGRTSAPRRGPNPSLTHKDVEALIQARIQSQVLPAIAKASEDTKNELYRTLVEVVSDPTQPLTHAKLCEVFGIPSAESSHVPQNDRIIKSDKASCDPSLYPLKKRMLKYHAS